MPASDPRSGRARPWVRVAGPDDLAFLMATERLPGYDALVAQWDLATHRARLADPETRYLVGGWHAAQPLGFAILEQLGDVHQGVKLKRIAVTQPGAGFGRPFLLEVVGWAFAHTATARVWLDVFTYNERARHVYRSSGFREDGLLRQAYLRADGLRVDRVIMSVLRGEWAHA